MNEKRFDGLAVSELENRIYRFEIDHEPITIRQTFISPTPHYDVLEFRFDMMRPVRFRIDVMLPENAVNACVTLNSAVLIDYCSEVFPKGCEFPVASTCGDPHDEKHEKVSTLVPGQFQSISMKWSNTDVLKFYFYYDSFLNN